MVALSHEAAPGRPEASEQRVSETAGVKQAYSRPCLRCFGDIRDLTLGGTGDTFESGSPGGSIYFPPNPLF
jgi:hypothetical protein